MQNSIQVIQPNVSYVTLAKLHNLLSKQKK